MKPFLAVPAANDTPLPDQVPFGAEERESFAQIVESSMRVRRLTQFFLWTQGDVQRLLPHEILVYGVPYGNGSGFAFQRLSSTRYFKDTHFAEICRPATGLIPQVMSRWPHSGGPMMVSSDHLSADADAQWQAMVKDNELGNLVAHGVRGLDGKMGSFFCFSRVGLPFGPRLAHLLWLLTPHLHETLSRVLVEERRISGRVMRVEARVTEREAEILRWIRDGKTNRDIAEILSVSPSTVKNHIQKILRKMGVENRSHAVARAISSGILSMVEG